MNEDIIVLSNKDQARKRINVFHGSSENWINMAKELLGNSLDIFKKTSNNNGEIKIIIHNRNKIEFSDSATGIPVEGVASDGSPNYEAIFERPFSGSNFSNSFASVGQNGIFLYTLTMTCEDIEYFISRPNGKIYNMKYHKGDRIGDLKVIGKDDKTYTHMIFSLDEEVWSNPCFTFEEISNITQAQASLSKAKIIVEDKENNKYVEFNYPNGIEDYFNEITQNKTIISDNIKIQKVENYEFVKKTSSIQNGGKENIVETKYVDNISVDLVFNYTSDADEDFQKEFLNTADLLLHGTIQEGIYVGFKNSIDNWLNKNNRYNAKEKHITINDISTGLNYICNMSSLYVEYDNQIKQKTSVKRYKNIIKDIIEEYMEVFFIENTLMSEKICMQVLLNSRVRDKAEQSRLDIKKKLSNAKPNGLSVKVEGLKHCDMRHSTLEERILLLDEGISANSTIIDSFDNRIMGAYGLKGRFINSLKGKVMDVLNNVPAKGVIDALGCGIEIPQDEKKKFKDIKTFDIKDLKYGSIGILCDSDAFGKAISLSLITFFYKFMRTLLKQGRIYFVISPRFQIETKKGVSHYVYDENEKLEVIKKIGAENVSNITIRKGLGEFNADEFWDLVLSPEAREKTFIRVKYIEDEEEMIDYYFNALMGEDIVNRKKFIRENIVNVNLEELD